MDRGWIKLHRQMAECAELQDPNAVAVWVRLLLRASTTARRVPFRNRIVALQPGQVATSYRQLSKETGVPLRRLRTILRNFSISEMLKIDTAKDTDFSLLTICNFKAYQVRAEPADTAIDTEPTQVRHRADTQNKKGRMEEGEESESESYSPTKESRATKRIARARSGQARFQSDYEEAWKAYPLRAEDKHDKAGCYRLWLTAIRTSDAEAITAAARQWYAEQSANPYRIGLRRWLKDKHYLHEPPIYRAGDGEHSDPIGEAERMTLATIRKMNGHGHEEFTGTHSCMPDGASPDIWDIPDDDGRALVVSERPLH